MALGSLTLAKTIADNPDAHSVDQLRGAWGRLQRTSINGGVRNSERATARLQRRLDRLTAAIHRREKGDYRREREIEAA
jgi:hypothetical protein